MKILIITLLFLIIDMAFFFLFSSIGILWYSYKDIISSGNWFIMYQMLIGIWISLGICHCIWTDDWGLD